MKHIALLLLLVGVSLCASFGARLSPEMNASMVIKGKAKLLGLTTAKAKEAFCAVREVKIAADGCKGDEVPKPAPKGDVAEAEPTFGRLLAEKNAAVAVIQERGGIGDKDRAQHQAWVAAALAEASPAARSQLLKPVDPSLRLSSWFDLAGVLFLVGVVLIVTGALIARKVVKAEAMAEPSGEEGGARDFGELLIELSEAVEALAGQMGQMAAIEVVTVADMERIKVQVEALQVDSFERIVASRNRIQARLGIGGFAEVFGPFSAAERRINRSWSALVDQHWPEAFASVTKAALDLKTCQDTFERVSAKRA